MFQSMRPNSRAYIFFKGDNKRLEQGYVTNQPVQRPKYSIPQNFSHPQEMVVDITVKTENGTYNFAGIPANLDVADTFCNGEAAVISDSREAMSAEVLSTKQKSQDALDSADYHHHTIEACDVALGQLNPDFAERKERDAEFDRLKGQVNDMSGKLDLILEQIGHKSK